jgi:hypothetical protein
VLRGGSFKKKLIHAIEAINPTTGGQAKSAPSLNPERVSDIETPGCHEISEQADVMAIGDLRPTPVPALMEVVRIPDADRTPAARAQTQVQQPQSQDSSGSSGFASSARYPEAPPYPRSRSVPSVDGRCHG